MAKDTATAAKSGEHADKQALAEERTDWAEDRTILANERTFAGWMRTGMGAIAIAVGLRAIFGQTAMGYAPARIAATFFCLVAIYIFWAARQKACATVGRLRAHQARPLPTRSVTIISTALSVGAAGTAGLLWLV
ncbi:DUF202 domain-containing protein [Mesobaculum littorinae]|uniref:DUF202 domain-containing protein n=1 Tax=Mesobaculum littorinae TaxID=2486419 RepID=A0A438AFG1_9RHOB|nr:DUF202 domain-containing protein [Mesobaculum littorinae]RVV97463.1 DUF202 domain-containing protein [Mesobaculum littorinae]